MAKYTCDLAFTAIFRKTVEVDSKEEAQAILDAATIEDVYQNFDWNIDPWEFEKDILSCDEIEDDDATDGKESA